MEFLRNSIILNCIGEHPETETLNFFSKFKDGQKVEDLPKPPRQYDYWKNVMLKKNYYDYTREEAECLLDCRIEFLYDYCERFSKNKLSKQELHKIRPLDFKGPYLPNKDEIEKIKELEIAITWNPSENNLLFKNRKQSESQSTISFSSEHWDILINQWKQFQEEYEIYDLRPLIGERCAIVQKDEDGGFKLVFYRLVKQKTFRKFVLYMCQNIPTAKFWQMKTRLSVLCDMYVDGKFQARRTDHVKGLEFRMIEILRERYPYKCSLFRAMSLLIGKRTSYLSYNVLKESIIYKNVPFRDGPWTKDEDLMLLNNVMKSYKTKKLRKVLKTKSKIGWANIFQNIKTRHQYSNYMRWRSLKSQLHRSLMTDSNDGKKCTWTVKDTVELIESLYHSEYESKLSIDWEQLAKKFPGFSDVEVRSIFYQICNSRVPYRIRRSFSQTLTFLYGKVKPVYELKYRKYRNREAQLDVLIGYKAQKRGTKDQKLKNFFLREGCDADDEVILMDRSDDGPGIVDSSDGSYGDTRSENESHTQETTQKEIHEKIMFVEEENDLWQVMMNRAGFKTKVLVPGKTLRHQLDDDVTLDTEDDEEPSGSPKPRRSETNSVPKDLKKEAVNYAKTDVGSGFEPGSGSAASANRKRKDPLPDANKPIAKRGKKEAQCYDGFGKERMSNAGISKHPSIVFGRRNRGAKKNYGRGEPRPSGVSLEAEPHRRKKKKHRSPKKWRQENRWVVEELGDQGSGIEEGLAERLKEAGSGTFPKKLHKRKRKRIAGDKITFGSRKNEVDIETIE